MSALYYPQGVSAHPPPPPSAATASHSNVTSRTALASAGHHAHHLAAAAAQRSAKRLPRLPLLQQSHASRSFRHAGSPRESFEPSLISTYRRDFDAARSFELDDDELFCPFHLLTEDDLHSIHSSGSDRSSLSSASPASSPLQHQLHPASALFLPASSPGPVSQSSQSLYQAVSQPKIHQPLAQRARNPIPIVDPSTRATASPPTSISPARQMRQQQQTQHHFVSRQW